MDVSVQVADGDRACLSHVPPSTPERADLISETLHSRVKMIIGLLRHVLEGSKQSQARCYSKRYRVGGGNQDITSGPQHLRTKRIVEPGMRKGKKVTNVQDSSGANKTRQHSTWSKRKRERVIEADPHFYRPSQRRSLS